MGVFKAGFWAAKSLVRMRVILAGEGIVREEGGSFRATLPGKGYLVDIDDRARTARMSYPGGGPLSTEIDLDNESGFCSFMHNVDVCIAGGGRIPTVMLALADEYARACGQGDARLASIVADGNLDLPRRDGAWIPGPAPRALAEAGRHTDDKELSDAAEAAVEWLGRQPGPSAAFDTGASMARWVEMVERWAGRDADVHPTDDGEWVRVVTRVGLDAAARLAGTDMNKVLTDAGGQRVAFERARSYALRDVTGAIVAVAVATATGLEVTFADSYDPAGDEVDALRSALGLETSSPAP